MDPEAEAIAAAIGYHERTKHQLHRYARSPGYLDWATQPNPFRTYAGAPRVSLPLGAAELTTPYDALYEPGAVPVQPLDRRSLGIFFELSLGLTAWKQAGTSRWALRANPSSGNLHPTEGYAVVPSLAQIDAGLYHYLARDHTLERRATLTTEAAARLVALLPVGGFLVGLSSIHWREAWKYGERAFRYCQHDTGHAIAALRYAAGTLGWRALVWDDQTGAPSIHRARTRAAETRGARRHSGSRGIPRERTRREPWEGRRAGGEAQRTSYPHKHGAREGRIGRRGWVVG